ncbi:MAG: flagellar hook basal-body protein [Planctomycetota bacterium]
MDAFGQRALVDGMSTLQRAQEAVAHNLANATSPGFKRRATFVQAQSFQELLGAAQRSDPSLSASLDWQQGDLEPTGERTHLAVEGDGFLVVETPNGQRALSRGGQVTFGADGTLRLLNGAQLIGTNGQPVRVDTSYQLEIGSNGQISQPGRNGQSDVGSLSIVQHQDRGSLRSIGAGLYELPNGELDSDLRTAGPSVALRQGYLERSNVDVMSEMVRMISVQRGFEASSRALTTMGQFHESFASSFDR